jgi:hypothetical protein
VKFSKAVDWEVSGDGCAPFIKNVSVLGDGACCSWSDDKIYMTIRLGNNANSAVGDPLQFVPSSLVSLSGNAWTDDEPKALVMESEEDITPAKAVIKAPSLAAKCSDLYLDASASQGG